MGRVKPSPRANDRQFRSRQFEGQPRHGADRPYEHNAKDKMMMNKMLASAVALIAIAAAGAANAATADAGAGAKIIAPLQITRTADLYFGTIAPSTTVGDTVSVAANGSRTCGPALTCLTSDHTAAAFAVTGEADAFYTISLPKEIEIVNGNGTAMKVSAFNGSKADGQLLKGEDSFSVGGTLAVAALQEAGKYKGSFTVAVEYQ